MANGDTRMNLTMIKRLLFFLCLVIVAGCTNAQTKDNGTIAHYRILRPDSTFTSWNDLKKGQPAMLIYFGTDCPHCQKLTMEMTQKMNVFKNIQIIMVTFSKTEYPWMGMIKNFNRDYSLFKYQNITMGTEYPDFLKYGFYPVQRYYGVQTTPYIAIYNKQGKLSKAFSKEPKIEDLTAAVKKAIL
jgi:thiol-disulfide isomerase/thioredoxin